MKRILSQSGCVDRKISYQLKKWQVVLSFIPMTQNAKALYSFIFYPNKTFYDDLVNCNDLSVVSVVAWRSKRTTNRY